MNGDLKKEVREVTRSLKGWVAYQKELGVRGFARCGTCPKPEELGEFPSRVLTLKDVREELGDCTRCALCESRTQIVFGVGPENAELMFVGEAPGADEDKQGEPFVGRAGQLLTKIINAMKFDRKEVYITNVNKCRPPNNRDPKPEEVAACEPFLIRQIQVIKPQVLVALGKWAAQTLLQSETPISALRGRFHDYHGIPLMPTFHPAAILRNPGYKRPVWDDMKQVMARMGKEVS
jgi:DNA polymerase